MKWEYNHFLFCDTNPYINLAAAILRQAYVDYVDRLLDRPVYRSNNEYCEGTAALERFFRSDYCRRISFGTNEELMRRAYIQALKIRHSTSSHKGVHRNTHYFNFEGVIHNGK